MPNFYTYKKAKYSEKGMEPIFFDNLQKDFQKNVMGGISWIVLKDLMDSLRTSGDFTKEQLTKLHSIVSKGFRFGKVILSK